MSECHLIEKKTNAEKLLEKNHGNSPKKSRSVKKILKNGKLLEKFPKK